MRRQTDAMVIHHFQNLDMFRAMYRLAHFVVIHQDKLPLHFLKKV